MSTMTLICDYFICNV